MFGPSETDKEVSEIAAIVLCAGLVLVFLRVLFRYFYKGNIYFLDIFKKVKPLTVREQSFLSEFLLPFNDFNPNQQGRFIRRLQWLKSKKKFVFYGEHENKEELKLFVCSAICLLTMGMQRFQLSRSVARIIIYPSKYYSNLKRQHHLGEYNPAFKILVFSADTLKEGFRIPNDNVNLAIHEIAHALCFETKGYNSWESRRFQYGLHKLRKLLSSGEFHNQIKEEDYFRDYGLKNVFELFAVLTENFIESPSEFRQKNPQLYDIVRIMYGFDFQNMSWELQVRNVL